jgi:hypothetical protein
MIVANLATYPPRRAFLSHVLAAISPQVDRINLVLNEYESVPEEVTGFPNVRAVIPHEDTKDVGKFYTDVSDAEFVFFIDDDLAYPPDYVARTLDRLAALPERRVLAGYHCSIYERPRITPSWTGLKRFAKYYLQPDTIANYRRVLNFPAAYPHPVIVDQVATNAAVMRAELVPPYDYMRSSQKFVDVRLAKWCFEREIRRICLPREEGWLQPSDSLGFRFEETIYRGFTLQHHSQTASEIWSYAFRTPGVGGHV